MRLWSEKKRFVSYSDGSIWKTNRVCILSNENGKILLGEVLEYKNELFYLDTKEKFSYLGFTNNKFIGRAKRGEYLIYFDQLSVINSNVFLTNPFTKKKINARCAAESICNCSLEKVKEVCLHDNVCREQVATLDTIIDGHYYEIELVVGRPEYRIKKQ